MKYRITLESGIAIMVPDSETMVGIVAAHHKEVIGVERLELTYVNIKDGVCLFCAPTEVEND